MRFHDLRPMQKEAMSKMNNAFTRVNFCVVVEGKAKYATYRTSYFVLYGCLDDLME